MLLNQNKRNEILIECARILGYISSEQIPIINKSEGNFDSVLLEKKVISLEQKTALQYFFTYYCLLYNAKHHGHLNDSQVRTLIQNKCSNFSKGETKVDLNYLEKQILKNNGKQIIDSLCQSKVFSTEEHQIISQWADNGSSDTDLKAIGHYKISEVLGTGGMGKVYKAYHPGLQKTVAIKVLLQLQNAHPKTKQRFFAEAQMMSQLKHPNIVSVHDLGVENGVSFIVMDFVEGTSLKEYLQKSKIPLRKACKIMSEVAMAVDYAHQHNIIHRDLKPGNIMIDNNNHVWLMDFGLAKNTKINQDLTNTGQVLGTPKYMSPEQANGDSKNVSYGSDIYALGVILYEMLTGVCPIQGSTHSKVIYNILHQEVKALRFYNKNIPAKLESICFKAMQKEIQSRYQNAREMADDINNFLQGKSISANHSVISYHVKKNKQKYIVSLFVSTVIAISICVGIYIGQGNKNNDHMANRIDSNITLEDNDTEKIAKPSKEDLKKDNIEVEESEQIDEKRENDDTPNTPWFKWKAQNFGIAYLVKKDWEETKIKSETNFMMIGYEKKEIGIVTFFFGKVLNSDLEDAISDFEEDMWSTKLGFSRVRTMEKKYKVNSLEGKRIDYDINRLTKKESGSVKVFYSLKDHYFRGAIVSQIEENPDAEKLMKSMFSIHEIDIPGKENKVETVTHLDVTYDVNSSWKKKVLGKGKDNNVMYSPARHSGIQFICFKKVLEHRKTTEEFVKIFEENNIAATYNYEVKKTERLTVNNLEGIIATYHLKFKKKNISLYAEHFYTFRNGHWYIICTFVLEKFKDENFGPLKEVILSVKPVH